MMSEIQFIFSGGLGNQIFQYLSSLYIANKLKNSNISYALSDHLINGNREFELNQLLVNKITLEKEIKINLLRKFNYKLIKKLNIRQNRENIINKKLFFLKEISSYDFNYQNKIVNPLALLLEKLNKSESQVKITGHWQNPISFYFHDSQQTVSYIRL